MESNRLVQANFIAEKLHDQTAIKFHRWAIYKLGFSWCSQLAAEIIQYNREGKIKNMGKYYNRCITNAIITKSS